MAPNAGKLKMMRVVVREDFSRSRCDALVKDIALALHELKSLDEKSLQQQKDHMRMQHVAKQWRKKTNNHYADEEHSLKGKHGKTHGVC